MKKRTKTLLTCLAVPLGVGAVSGFLTQGSMDAFEKLNQPPLAPPGWVFPVGVNRTVCNDGNSLLSDRASAGIGREEKSIDAVWNTACSELSVAGIFL